MESRTSETLILTHSLLLGERLYLFARLRFVAAAGILLGAFFATYVVGVRGLNLLTLSAAAGFLAVYDVGAFVAVRPHLGQGDEKASHRRLVYVAHLTILLDYVVLTIAIWLVGGGRSPFLAFYLLHAILASVLLSRRAAYGHALVGYLLLAALVLGEWSGWIPRNSPVGAVPAGTAGDFPAVLTVLFVYGLLTAVTTVLTTGIVRLLRQNERGLLEASERLERLADMRRSFLHVVLHDLRSPVGTVVTMLRDTCYRSLPGWESQALGPARPQGSALASRSFVASPRPTMATSASRATPGREVRSSSNCRFLAASGPEGGPRDRLAFAVTKETARPIRRFVIFLASRPLALIGRGNVI